MIREKNFRLHRQQKPSSGQKFVFSFSNIQAVQVPKGWDKLVLSLASSESGKAARRSGKVPVKNGTCRWTEALSESMWFSKEVDECCLKFLVSMGTSRSGVLGEAMLNLAAFLSSESPVPVSLPLNNCNYTTVLQFEVTCLTPKTDLRNDKCNYSVHEHTNDDDAQNSPHPHELSSREMSFPPSVSRYSSDSMDDSVERQSFSSQSDRNGRQDSIESSDCASYSTYGSIKSACGPFARESHGTNQRQGSGELLQQNGCSASDARVEEVEAGARMWEQKVQKLAVDLEVSRKALSDQNLTMTNLNTELEMSHADGQKLTQEIEHLKSLLEESVAKQNDCQDSKLEETAQSSIRKELEDEIRFRKDQNEDLSLQLRKTQESNIELISILQEMEETVEKQKHQIECLSANKLESIYDSDKNGCMHEDSNEINAIEQVLADELKSFHECDSDTSFYGMSVTDIHEPIPREDNCRLEVDMNLQDLQQTYQDKILVLERMLDDRIIETEFEQGLRNHILKGCLVECNHRLDNKQQKIMNLEAALSKALSYGDSNVSKQMVCNELTEENLCLLFELTESRMKASKPVGSSSHNVSGQNKSAPEVSEWWAKQLTELEEENIYMLQRVSGLEAQLRYLADAKETTRLELQHSEYQVKTLQDQVRRLEEEIESDKHDTKQKLLEMQERWSETQDECVNLGKLNVRFQATTETLIEENSILQNFCGELREQKLKFQAQCMLLEAKARKFQYSDCSCTEDAGKVEGNHSSSNNESKFKLEGLVAELESRLNDSELGRLKLAEENYVLQMQLQKLPELQNELLVLRGTLKEMKSETQLLKASLKSLLKEYEELKCERVSIVQKMSSMKEAVSEAEESRRKNNALEEKILRLEGDLIARDALVLQDAEIKNQLSRIQILNSQLLAKVKCLEDVREHFHRRLQFLEDGPEGRRDVEERVAKGEEDDCVSVKKRFLCIHPQLCECLTSQDNQGQIQHQVQVFDEKDHSTRSLVPEMDNGSNIQLCKNEVVGASDIQGMYKLQTESAQAIASKKLELEENMDSAKDNEKTSRLEVELQEIRDRYLQISLKYAEVESQREHLVMKLRALSCYNC